MRPAIATSLVIVAANAVIALTVRGLDAVDWPIAVALTVPMLAGSIVGARFGRRINPDNARLTFAALLMRLPSSNRDRGRRLTPDGVERGRAIVRSAG